MLCRNLERVECKDLFFQISKRSMQHNWLYSVFQYGYTLPIWFASNVCVDTKIFCGKSFVANSGKKYFILQIPCYSIYIDWADIWDKRYGHKTSNQVILSNFMHFHRLRTVILGNPDQLKAIKWQITLKFSNISSCFIFCMVQSCVWKKKSNYWRKKIFWQKS